ncbi:hypothetical protein AXF42_Ash009334 [Apostasia shenzhenica]|uniref:Uncharacterized protein n=1 Tax=Apostasia shenzhenica TaxID=1088818 RepID=A0A2I0B3T7_9ASPA|nr:hypothetical protein AXF42_Ash009334 [Apostasia shenzhenica]
MPAMKSGSRPPWIGLAAAVWVQTAAGSGYNFPLYSPSLKSVMGFNQRQLTMLGVANDVGENFGMLPGVVCNRFPPWLVLLIGSASCFVGYGVIYLAVSRTVEFLPYWLLWLALCVATNSSAWLGTGVLVTNMRNFPCSRGTVAGILKGYMGLSAAVYTLIYTGILHNSSTKLLLFLTLGLPAICLAMMYFVRHCTPATDDDSSEHGHFLFTQITGVLLGLYLLISTILDDLLSANDTISYILFSIMILFLLSPLAIPLKMTLFPNKHKKSGLANPSSSTNSSQVEQDKSEPLLAVSSSATNLGSLQEQDDSSDVDILLAEGEGAVHFKKKRRPKRGEDFTFREALIKADFWLLFLVYFLGVGSGVTVLNNLAQIGIAAGVEDTNILLCLFSFCNFAGRLGGGSVSEYFVRLKMLPRSTWMACTQIVMAVTYLLFALGLNSTLYASTALLGICYGVQFSVMVPTASELFGLKHFGIIYNFMLLGNPLGALLLSGILAGYVYDKEAEKQGGTTCLGPSCFGLTFLVLSGVCALGSLLSVVLTVRIRPVYQMLYSSGSFRLPRTSQH